MMSRPDEMFIAAIFIANCQVLGYEVTGIIPRGEEALNSIKQTSDIIFEWDISYKASFDCMKPSVMQKATTSLLFI